MGFYMKRRRRGFTNKIQFNPERGSPTAERFQGYPALNVLIPRFSLALEPWAEISERLRR